MPRGGRRQGQVGTAYPNRTDLNAPQIPQPTFKNLQYGQVGAIQQAEKAVPPGPAPPQGGGPPLPPPGPMPGEGPAFGGATLRPNEPLTHGLPSGPGAGPEALGPVAPTQNLRGLLTLIASAGDASPDVKALAQFLQRSPS